MSEFFVVSLAGLSWRLPHLPFRVIKRVQPALVRLSQDWLADPDPQRGLMRLDEVQLEDLADAVWMALSEVDKTLTWEQFFELPFDLGELAAALPSLLSACGLRVTKAGEAGSNEKK